MARISIFVPALIVVIAVSHPSARARNPPSLDALFAAYRAGDFQAIDRQVTTIDQFETLRRALGPKLDSWRRAPTRMQMVFVIDFATAALNHEWIHWLDVLHEGCRFVIARPDLIGAKPDEDAFEIAWHKTSIALLEGLRRPDSLEEYGIRPLTNRMAAAPTSHPMLIDPWIEIARGVSEEQFGGMEHWGASTALDMPRSNSARAAVAIQHFDIAAKYERTRPEAIVRKAWVLIQTDRSAEGLVVLDGSTVESPDPAVRYWRRLFRGRALANLNRLDEAVDAYADALTIMPQAQAPAVALTELELRRGHREAAYAWTRTARMVSPDFQDPWPRYFYADFRLFKDQLVALRKAAQ